MAFWNVFLPFETPDVTYLVDVNNDDDDDDDVEVEDDAVGIEEVIDVVDAEDVEVSFGVAVAVAVMGASAT